MPAALLVPARSTRLGHGLRMPIPRQRVAAYAAPLSRTDKRKIPRCIREVLNGPVDTVNRKKTATAPSERNEITDSGKPQIVLQIFRKSAASLNL